MLYTPIQWMAVWFEVRWENQRRKAGGLFNAVGLTVTPSAKKTTGLIVEIKVITSSCHALGLFPKS